MNKPILAIDIDDVLARHNHGLAMWCNQKYGTKLTEHDFTTGNRWSAVWQLDEEETERRSVEFHNELAHGRFEVMDGAQEAINRLVRRYELHVVTIRRKVVIPTTHDWLHTHFTGVFKEVHFVPFWETNRRATKAEVCKQIGASCLVDDILENCEDVARSGIDAVLFGANSDAPNAKLHPKISAASNWQAVLEILDVE
jgi:5'(3')-deoxyribonucleotidase